MSAEWAEVINAISELIPVLGGAIIGVIGGLVGTSYAHKLSQNSDKVKEKKAKLEQLVTELYEIEIWIKKLENYYFYGAEEILEQSPVSKIEALQALYFPQLTEQVMALSNTVHNYRGWLITGAQLRLSAKTPTPPNEHLDKLNLVYTPLKVSVSKAIEQAKVIIAELNDS